jgi:hypothetical protein
MKSFRKIELILIKWFTFRNGIYGMWQCSGALFMETTPDQPEHEK